MTGKKVYLELALTRAKKIKLKSYGMMPQDRKKYNFVAH